MFTLAQPHYGYYNPHEELAMQQELQRRRQLEAYLQRQREVEESERRRQAYEAAVRAEYERRCEAELERQRQAELQRRRQAQQARGRHSMYNGGLESLFDALYGGQSPRQWPSWENRQEEPQSTLSPPPAAVEPEPQPEDPQVDTVPSYAAVKSILASFTTLQSEFIFPTQLDFLPGASPKLAYTPNNAPLHGYEHALTGLLTQLDAVESYGDEGVRKARKEAVKTIEKELERLDGMKLAAWKRVNEPQAQVSVEEMGQVVVDPTAIPLPEYDEVEDEAMEEVEQASVTVPEEPTAVDQRSTLESLVPTRFDSTNPSQSSTLLDVESDTPHEHPIDVDPTSMLTSPTSETSLTLPGDSTHGNPLPLTPNPEPLARSLTSPTPSEASESDSDLEIEEYVDVETMLTPEDEDTELEVEKDRDLDLMHDWDLDF